jgi:hypothetical protein
MQKVHVTTNPNAVTLAPGGLGRAELYAGRHGSGARQAMVTPFHLALRLDDGTGYPGHQGPVVMRAAGAPRLRRSRGRRRKSVNPVIARRRAQVLEVVGLLLLVAVTGSMVWKALHVV